MRGRFLALEPCEASLELTTSRENYLFCLRLPNLSLLGAHDSLSHIVRCLHEFCAHNRFWWRICPSLLACMPEAAALVQPKRSIHHRRNRMPMPVV